MESRNFLYVYHIYRIYLFFSMTDTPRDQMIIGLILLSKENLHQKFQLSILNSSQENHDSQILMDRHF